MLRSRCRIEIILNAAALSLLSVIASAQSAAVTADRSFEVASIKPSDPADQSPAHIRYTPGGGLLAQNADLKTLILLAWRVQDSQIVGLPVWTRSARFDIEAKSAGPGPRDPRQLTSSEADAFQQLEQARLRALVMDRFGLKLHRETREMPVYALAAPRGDSKLTASPAGAGPASRGMRLGRGTLTGKSASTAMLAQALSDVTGKIVIDRTGLGGGYDFRLDWNPNWEQTAATGDSTRPSLFTAIQEQLGLKLEAAKGPVEVLVIDHVDRPSAN